MKIAIKVFLISLFVTSQVLCQSCETLLQSITLYPTVGETMKWSLTKTFIDGYNLSFKLSGGTDNFDIQPPISAADVVQTYVQPITRIVDVDSYKQAQNGAWLNGHAILDVSDSAANVLWAQAQSVATAKTPKFDIVTPVYSAKQKYTCFSLTYISSSQVIVDCADLSGDVLKNQFYIVNRDPKVAPTTVDNDNKQNLKSTTTARVFQTRIVKQNDKNEIFLYRGVPFYANPDQKGNSLIEVFVVEDTKVTPTKNDLDASTLGNLVGKPDYTFDLVDFYVDGDGHIFVLDAYLGLYEVYQNAEGKWLLENFFKLTGAKAFGLAVNTQVNQFGDMIHHVGILYYDYFALYTIPDSQEANADIVPIIYDLDFKSDTYPAETFSISQSRIVVKNDLKLYLFTIDSNSLVTTQVLPDGTLKLIYNPYMPNLISMSQTNAQTWEISDPFLILKKNDKAVDNTVFNIEGTSTLGATTKLCKSQVTYQILAADDTKLYSYKEPTFPSVVIYPTQAKFSLSGLVSAPNVAFTVANSTTEYESNFLANIYAASQPAVPVQLTELTPSNFPSADQVIYADILTKSQDPSHFYQIFQLSDSTLQMWDCRPDSTIIPNGNLNCKLSLSNMGKSKLTLTKYLYQHWFNFDQITYAFLVDQFSLDIYIADDGEPMLAKNITFDSKQQNQKIQSFIFLKNLLYVVQQDAVLVYQTLDEFPLLLTINADLLAQQGYIDKWTPRNIFGNKVLRPNIIFLDNTINLIIADYHDGEFTLLSVIPYKNDTVSISVGVGLNTFFLAQVNDQISEIEEYDYQDLNNIQLLKSLNTYVLKLQQPLQADFSDDNGYFFVRTYCTVCDKSKIAVFQPSTLQHDSLYQAIYFEELVKEGSSMVLSVGGDDTMYIYTNANKHHKEFSLLKTPQLVVLPSGDAFVQNLNVQLTATAYSQDKKDFTAFTVTLLDTMSDIQTNSTSKNQNILIQQKDQVIPIDDSMFKGQMVGLAIDCTNCGENITIWNKINNTQPQIVGNDVILSSAPFAFGQQLLQSELTLYFIKDLAFAQSPVPLFTEQDKVKCTKVVGHATGAYVVSLCQQSDATYKAEIVSCISPNQCTSLGQSLGKQIYILSLDLISLKSPSKVLMVENSLLIYDSFYQVVLVYTIDMNSTPWAVQNDLTLSKELLPSSTDLVDFDFQTIEYNGQTLYKIYLLDPLNGIYFVDTVIQNNQMLMVGSVEHLDIKSMLTNAKEFLFAKTLFTGLTNYGVPQVVDNTTNVVKTQLIFTTSDVANYAISMSFDMSSPLSGAKLVDQALTISFNRYGDWLTTVGVTVNGNYVIIPYMNLTIILATQQYLIPEKQEYLAADDKLPLLLMIGGAPVENLASDCTLVSEGNSTYLIVGNSGFTISTNPSLNVQEADKIESQDITFKALNDFGSASYQSRVQTNMGSSGSSFKWWIILIIVAGVIVLGVIGFCIYKSKSKKTDPLLGDN